MFPAASISMSRATDLPPLECRLRHISKHLGKVNFVLIQGKKIVVDLTAAQLYCDPRTVGDFP
jgi:hypothetical protein